MAWGSPFALREMLQLNGPHLVVSLGAFNLGVALGQIAFATAVWGAMLWLPLRVGPRQELEDALRTSTRTVSAVSMAAGSSTST